MRDGRDKTGTRRKAICPGQGPASGLGNREATKLRELDTRRKVILGGALLDLAERDSGAAAMVERLIRNLSRDQDRKAFADW